MVAMSARTSPTRKHDPAAPDNSEAGTRPQKRSLTIAGHRTSISLEAAFWDAVKDFAARDDRSVADLVGEIDASRGKAGLSGAIRVYVLHRTQREAS